MLARPFNVLNLPCDARVYENCRERVTHPAWVLLKLDEEDEDGSRFELPVLYRVEASALLDSARAILTEARLRDWAVRCVEVRLSAPRNPWLNSLLTRRRVTMQVWWWDPWRWRELDDG